MSRSDGHAHHETPPRAPVANRRRLADPDRRASLLTGAGSHRVEHLSVSRCTLAVGPCRPPPFFHPVDRDDVIVTDGCCCLGFK